MPAISGKKCAVVGSAFPDQISYKGKSKTGRMAPRGSTQDTQAHISLRRDLPGSFLRASSEFFRCPAKKVFKATPGDKKYF